MYISDRHPATLNQQRITLEDQLYPAWSVYRTMVQGRHEGFREGLRGGWLRRLMGRPTVPLADVESLRTAFSAWLTPDKVAYTVDQLHGAAELVYHQVVITPRGPVSAGDYRRMANALQRDRRGQPFIGAIALAPYTPEQIADMAPSTDDHHDFTFALVPTRSTPGANGTVVQQRAALAAIQQRERAAGRDVLLAPVSPVAELALRALLSEPQAYPGEPAAYVGIRHFGVAETSPVVATVGPSNAVRSVAPESGYPLIDTRFAVY